MGQIKSEKVDPLLRIQEEIKEVVRREEEHRQLITGSSPMSPGEYNDDDNDAAKTQIHDNDSSNSLSISPIPQTLLTNCDVSLNAQSLAHSENSINSKESIDEDSGISASPSPINGVSAATTYIAPTKPNKEQRYIGPNCYTNTPEPPRQTMIASTVPITPSVINRQRLFAFNPANKGVMQRFIASRGKIQLNNNNGSTNKMFLNTKAAVALLNTDATRGPMTSNTPTPTVSLTSPLHKMLTPEMHTPPIAIQNVTMTPPHIERDAEGRVIRRGYVPAEVKIQKEIKDLQAREHELKKRNKFRQSTSDLLEAMENGSNEDTDDEDSEVEHCLGPRQLRSAKSISEISYSTQLNNNSSSPRATPSPDFEIRKNGFGTMRPAMSLAQLCDLPPEEAPSSHRLIVEWENRIQMNAARNGNAAVANEE